MEMKNRINLEKFNAAKAAIEYIKPNSIVGLGTGSTSKFLIQLLGDKIQNGQLRGISTVASSIESLNQAKELGIPTLDLNAIETIDITIDGADEFDSNMNLIKGGGGALLREKILAALSTQVLIIADSSKKVKQLGKFPLPVEIMQIAAHPIFKKLESLNLNPQLRKNKNDEPLITDNSNFIIDLNLQKIENVNELDNTLKSIPGIVENGLFIGYATKIIMGKFDEIEIVEKNTPK